MVLAERERPRGVQRQRCAREQFDVVMIGAGMGGLACAALLARAGKRVLVLEHHRVVGGSCTVFKRRGFTFDVGLHYLGECGSGGRVPRILEQCGVDDVEFIPMDEDLDVVTLPEGREPFVIPTSREKYKSRLLQRFPEERPGIERYFRFLVQIQRVVGTVSAGTTWEKLSALARSPLVLKYARRGTAGEVVDSCTTNPELKAILLARNGVYGVAPGRVSALYDAGMRIHYFSHGASYPRGGGQAISDSLAAAIKAAGGEVRTRCSVDRVMVRERRAAGVLFHDKYGNEHQVSAPVVVSNADAKRTFFDLVGRAHFPKAYCSKLEGFEMAAPFFMAFLGLDMAPSELPYGNTNQWVLGDLDVDGEYATIANGRAPRRPSLFISTATTRAGSCQGNKVALELMTLIPAGAAFWGVSEAAVRDGSYSDSPAYQARKEALLEACLDQGERVIPNLRDRIVFCETASPMTHGRYIRSTRGSPYGFASTPAQFFKQRPGPDTPLDGLYLCGMNTPSGHGVFGVLLSAVKTADAILGSGLGQQLLKPTSGV